MKVLRSKSSDIKYEGVSEPIDIVPRTYSHYSWLIGSPDDEKWEFPEYLEGQYASRLRMSWDSTFKLTSLTAKHRWEYWVRTSKDICISLFESKSLFNKSSSRKNKAQNIKSICQYMCFQRHRLSLAEVDKTDVKAFEEYLKKKGVSVSYAEELLRTLRQFWSVPVNNTPKLKFDPYPRIVKLTAIARKIAIKNGHTKTLKPEVGLHLIEHGLHLVIDSKQTIENFDLYNELKKTYVDHASAYFRRTEQNVCELIKQVRILYGAAISLTLSLTAMRKHESSHIIYQDAIDLINGDKNILTGRVHKTSASLKGKETQRCAVLELQQALEVIIRLTKDVREKSNCKFLLMKLSTHNSVSRGHTSIDVLGTTSLYKLLDLFAKDAGYTEKTLRPHMFRRFFAMMWAWRFETGDLYYLSKMLYHNGYEFTSAYTEDEDVWEFMPDEMKELTHRIFEDILIGEKQIAGGFSRTVERYKRIIQAHVSVVDPELVAELVDTLIERNNYVVVPAADGYCFMSPTRASISKCSTNTIMPDYSNRNESLCAICSNFCVTDNKIEIWERRLVAHQKTFDKAVSKALKAAAKKGVTLANRMINSIEIKVKNHG